MDENLLNIEALDIAVIQDNLQEPIVKNHSYLAAQKELKNQPVKEKYLIQSPGDQLSENEMLDTSNNSELYLI